jgi:hypothetical protein
MNQPSQTSKPFWEQILDRYQQPKRWLRSRVSLVFLRLRLSSGRWMPTCIVQYPLTLQIRVSWPWSMMSSTREIVRSSSNRVVREGIVSAQSERMMRTDRVTDSFRNSSTEVVTVPATSPEPRVTTSTSSTRHTQANANLAVNSTRQPFSAIRDTRSDELIHDGRFAELIHEARFDELRRVFFAGKTTSRFLNASSVNRQVAVLSQNGSRFMHLRQTTRAMQLRRTTTAMQVMRSMPQPASIATTNRLESRHNSMFLEMKDSALRTVNESPVANGTNGNARVERAASRSRFYSNPAPRNLAIQPAQRNEDRSQAAEQKHSAPLRTNSSPAQPPALNISWLSEEVYRHIQRKVRVERERRGL